MSTVKVWDRGILPMVIVSVVVVAGGITQYTWNRRRRNQLTTHNNANDRINTNLSTYTTSTQESNCIYMDYNGTTPIYRQVYDAMIPYFTIHYGNPGSTHVYGDIPQNAIRHARYQILKYLLSCPIVEGDTTDEPNNTTTTTTTTKGIIDDDPNHHTITPLSSCIFTSCGTEADNFIIHVALQLWKLRNTKNSSNSSTTTMAVPHIITTNIEHPAIEACLQMYEQQHICTVTRVPVQTDGRVLVNDMIHTIQLHASRTILVTMMLANNETGAIQPVKEISNYIRNYNQQQQQHSTILFATDAAQATGKISIALSDLGYPDMMAIVGHKFGTPKGIGCLYIRPGCLQPLPIPPNDDIVSPSTTTPTTTTTTKMDHSIFGLLVGGGQEYHWRGGTSNVPYIVGFGVAAQYTIQHLSMNQQHMESLRTRFIQQLIQLLGIENIRIHGPTNPQHRLPNTLSIGFGNGIDSTILLHDLRNVVAASAGATCHAPSTTSSCHTDGPVISSILKAMQIPDDWARGTIRLSVGPPTTMNEVDLAAKYIADAVRRQWKNKQVLA